MQMKPWTQERIRDRLRHPERLLEKRVCDVVNGKHYLNAYEYALFTNMEVCYTLSNCMHAEGFIIKDTVTPFAMHLAMISDNLHNYAALGKIKWNRKTFAGVLRRPDSIQLLLRRDYDINGFEFGLTFMPRLVGRLIYEYDLKIADVVRFKLFKKCKTINHIFV